MDDLADLLGVSSPLDTQIRFSTFRGADLIAPETRCMSLRQIADMIRAAEVTAEVAEGLRHPLLKLATFSGPRSDETLESITGIELDLDKGEIQPDEAIDLFTAAGIVALVYTSRRHTTVHPRIRVLLPLSRPVTPAARRQYAEQAAAVLGAKVDNVSFTASQAFYFAGVKGRERVVEITPGGDYLDRVAPAVRVSLPAPVDNDDDEDADLLRAVTHAKQERDFAADLESGKLAAALEAIGPDALDYHTITRIGMALHLAGNAGEKALNLWRDVANRSYWYESMTSGEPQLGGTNAGVIATLNGRRASAERIAHHQKKVWSRFNSSRRGEVVGLGSIYEIAEACGWVRAGVALADLEDLEPETDDDLADLIGVVTRAKSDNQIDAPVPDDPGVNPNNDWKSSLAITEEGEVKVCLHNVELIVLNDARLYGRLGYNLVDQCIVFVREPAKLRKKARDGKKVRQLTGSVWMHDEPRHRISGKRWTDDHENQLRTIIETPPGQGGYGIKVSDRDMRAAIRNVARQHTFHPIRDRLLSLKWDGACRAERLFVEYLGCPDDAYHRDVARMMLLGAVARACCPGHKFDFVPILEGGQGAGKSTFIRILALDWPGELAVDFRDNNKIIEAIQGAWIIEIPELEGFSKAETTTLKATVSRTHDKARLAWERNVQEFPRQCIFIGSTNQNDYLRDTTGGRRFWPVKCRVAKIDTDSLRQNIGQIWAEVVTWFLTMRAEHPAGDLPLYLSNTAAADTAVKLQESRRAETPEELLAAEMKATLDEPVSTDLDGTSTVRTITCVKEVWIDLLDRDPKALENQITTKLIGRALRMAGWEPAGQARIGKYGNQKIYRRS